MIHNPHLLLAAHSRGFISSLSVAESGFTRPGKLPPPAPAAKARSSPRPPAGYNITIIPAAKYTVSLTHICEEESRLIVYAVRLHATFPGAREL